MHMQPAAKGGGGILNIFSAFIYNSVLWLPIFSRIETLFSQIAIEQLSFAPPWSSIIQWPSTGLPTRSPNPKVFYDWLTEGSKHLRGFIPKKSLFWPLCRCFFSYKDHPRMLAKRLRFVWGYLLGKVPIMQLKTPHRSQTCYFPIFPKCCVFEFMPLNNSILTFQFVLVFSPIWRFHTHSLFPKHPVTYQSWNPIHC